MHEANDIYALMGTKVPSTTEPRRLKYHEIVFRLSETQPTTGVKPPDPVSKAEMISESE